MRTRVSLALLVTVFALGAAGCGSEDPAAVVVDTVAPAPVLDIDVQIVGSEIQVSWTHSTEPDLAGYQVYRFHNGVEDGTPAVVSTNTFVDATVEGAVTYRYEVAAFDATGNVGPRTTSSVLVVPATGSAAPRRSSSLGD